MPKAKKGGSIYGGEELPLLPLLESVTADGDEKPSQEKLQELLAALGAADAEECAAVAEFFERRLDHESVDVKVKCVRFMLDVTRLQRPELNAALISCCAKTLEALTEFTAEDHPKYGELPAKMVRNRAAMLLVALKGEGGGGAGRGAEGGLGLGMLMALLLALLALALGLHMNHGSPALLWHRAQRTGQELGQSLLATLQPPAEAPAAEPADEQAKPADDADDIRVEQPPPPPPPPPPPKLTSEETYQEIQSAFQAFDDGDIEGSVATISAQQQRVLAAHLDGDLTREEFEVGFICHLGMPIPNRSASGRERVDPVVLGQGYMNKALSKRLIGAVLEMLRKDLREPEQAGDAAKIEAVQGLLSTMWGRVWEVEGYEECCGSELMLDTMARWKEPELELQYSAYQILIKHKESKMTQSNKDPSGETIRTRPRSGPSHSDVPHGCEPAVGWQASVAWRTPSQRPSRSGSSWRA